MIPTETQKECIHMSQLFENSNNSKKSELLQLVTFRLGKEEFAIDILKVREINRIPDLTHMPHSPEFVEGIINLRGKTVPVINLRKRLSMPLIEFDKDHRIIVVDIAGQTVGFLVDSVTEVIRIPKNITEPPPSLVTGVESNFIKAVGKLEDRLLILLDLEQFLPEEEIEELVFEHVTH